MRRMVRRAISDPRCRELEGMLAGLDPRRELVYRLALLGLSPHCRSDRAWRARVDDLRAMLRLRERGPAAVQAEAHALAKDLPWGALL